MDLAVLGLFLGGGTFLGLLLRRRLVGLLGLNFGSRLVMGLGWLKLLYESNNFFGGMIYWIKALPFHLSSQASWSPLENDVNELVFAKVLECSKRREIWNLLVVDAVEVLVVLAYRHISWLATVSAKMALDLGQGTRRGEFFNHSGTTTIPIIIVIVVGFVPSSINDNLTCCIIDCF
jgi:hypothetical protein